MTAGGVISAIVIGLIIGALARLILPGRQNINIWWTMIVGIVAALVGTAVARAAGWVDTEGIDWLEILIQLLLAIIGVALVSGMNRRNVSS